MSAPRPTRIRYRWRDIRAALIVAAASIALPLAFLTIAAERVTP